MTIVQGDEGCIIFRYDRNTSKYYGFCIDSSGNYEFIAKDQNDNNVTTLRNGSSSAINQGLSQMNTVGVIAKGSELTMYINGHYVLVVNDNAYSSGSIGVGASENTNSTEVAFSNAQVWML